MIGGYLGLGRGSLERSQTCGISASGCACQRWGHKMLNESSYWQKSCHYGRDGVKRCCYGPKMYPRLQAWPHSSNNHGLVCTVGVHKWKNRESLYAASKTHLCWTETQEHIGYSLRKCLIHCRNMEETEHAVNASLLDNKRNLASDWHTSVLYMLERYNDYENK